MKFSQVAFRQWCRGFVHTILDSFCTATKTGSIGLLFTLRTVVAVWRSEALPRQSLKGEDTCWKGVHTITDSFLFWHENIVWTLASHADITLRYVTLRDVTKPRRWRQLERQKTIGLMSKTTTLHVQHAFLYIFLPSLHNYDVKWPNFKFFWRKRTARR